jgi:hypothetical protein
VAQCNQCLWGQRLHGVSVGWVRHQHPAAVRTTLICSDLIQAGVGSGVGLPLLIGGGERIVEGLLIRSQEYQKSLLFFFMDKNA